MSPDDYAALRRQLILHEGRRRTPYRDTAGKLTIGVGYNIDDRGLGPLRRAIVREVTMTELYSTGLTDAEIDRVLDADIAHFESRVRAHFPVFDKLDPVRQRVVLDFAFNLGKRALGFVRAIEALRNAIKKSRDPEMQRLYFTECAYHMMDSLWSTQVGDGFGKRYDRAERLATMMRTGEDYTR